MLLADSNLSLSTRDRDSCCVRVDGGEWTVTALDLEVKPYKSGPAVRPTVPPAATAEVEAEDSDDDLFDAFDVGLE